jgi:hypothetical protein
MLHACILDPNLFAEQGDLLVRSIKSCLQTDTSISTVGSPTMNIGERVLRKRNGMKSREMAGDYRWSADSHAQVNSSTCHS